MLRHGSSKKLISFKVNEIGPSIQLYVFVAEYFLKTNFALDFGRILNFGKEQHFVVATASVSFRSPKSKHTTAVTSTYKEDCSSFETEGRLVGPLPNCMHSLFYT